MNKTGTLTALPEPEGRRQSEGNGSIKQNEMKLETSQCLKQDSLLTNTDTVM